MSTAFSILILILGVVEIVFAINMEKFTRSKYKGEQVKDLKGLIQWEKVTTFILGVALIIFAIVSLMGFYDRFSNYFLIIILIIMATTFFGKKRYVDR